VGLPAAVLRRRSRHEPFIQAFIRGSLFHESEQHIYCRRGDAFQSRKFLDSSDQGADLHRTMTLEILKRRHLEVCSVVQYQQTSTRVKSIEERLGVRLLNRTTRSVSLTEAGRAYYDRCIQILSEIENAEEAAQMLQSKPRGILRLNTSPGVPWLISWSIAEYSARYPDVTARLAATSRMLDLVEEGYDLAIWYAATLALSFAASPTIA
jgi:hypothetical protein